MIKLLNKLKKEESGAIFVMALVAFVTGALLITPLLNYMSTGLNVDSSFDNRLNELYAAEGGVESALWHITTDGVNLTDDQGLTGLPQLLNDPGTPEDETIRIYSPAALNNRSVGVTIQYLDGIAFRIVSTATDNKGNNTVIEAIADDTTRDFSGMLDQVITSQSAYDIKNAEVSPEEGQPGGPIDNYAGDWPTPEDLAAHYWWDVQYVTPYAFDIFNLNGTTGPIGPLYRDGTLDIINSSNTWATLTLNDTLYITGQTDIGQTGKDFTIDLNGNAIFVESDITGGGTALTIGGKCTLIGPGAVIAVGDIYFAPNIEAGMDEPIFIMSMIGISEVQPHGDFYGSIAGLTLVDLQPGAILTYPDLGADAFVGINFPGLTFEIIYGVVAWEINQP